MSCIVHIGHKNGGTNLRVKYIFSLVPKKNNERVDFEVRKNCQFSELSV